MTYHQTPLVLNIGWPIAQRFWQILWHIIQTALNFIMFLCLANQLIINLLKIPRFLILSYCSRFWKTIFIPPKSCLASIFFLTKQVLFHDRNIQHKSFLRLLLTFLSSLFHLSSFWSPDQQTSSVIYHRRSWLESSSSSSTSLPSILISHCEVENVDLHSVLPWTGPKLLATM